jgi:hypothetical protein
MSTATKLFKRAAPFLNLIDEIGLHPVWMTRS